MSILRWNQARSVLLSVALTSLLSGFPVTAAEGPATTKATNATSPAAPTQNSEPATSESLPIKPWTSPDPEVLVVPAPVFPYSRESAPREERVPAEPIRKTEPVAAKKPAAPPKSPSEPLPVFVGEAKETFDRVDKALQELADGPMHSNFRFVIGKARKELREAFDRYREDQEEKPWKDAVLTAENFIQDVENP